METKIVYTESGKNAIDKYLENQKKQLEKEISEEKYVFGDDEIEITASDIKLYVEHKFYDKRKIERRKRLLYVFEVYLFIGTIMVIAGLLYPILSEMIEYNLLQFILTIMGSMFIIVGGFSWLYLYKKSKIKA